MLLVSNLKFSIKKVLAMIRPTIVCRCLEWGFGKLYIYYLSVEFPPLPVPQSEPLPEVSLDHAQTNPAGRTENRIFYLAYKVDLKVVCIQ